MSISYRIRSGPHLSTVRFLALVGWLVTLVVVPGSCQDMDRYAPNLRKDDVEGQKPPTTAGAACLSNRPQASRSADSDPLAPKIFNSSVQARGGDIIFFQGENLTASARVVLDIPNDAGPLPVPIVNRVGSMWIAAQIPRTVSAAFFTRVINDHGSSSAIRINGPQPYHLDTTQVSPAAQFRIFGQNLLYATCKPIVLIAGYPADVDMASSRDFMLVVRAPREIKPSENAEVLVDNGGGLGPAFLDGGVHVVAGSGDPLNLNVGWAASFDFSTRVITTTAACDGSTDDGDAIRRAILSAAALGGAIVQLPKGTCRIARTIDFESRVILRGAGRDGTILLYESNYPVSAVSKDRVGLENLQLLNAGSTQEGMIWRDNTRSFIRGVALNMKVSRQWFLTDNRDFLFTDNIVIQKGSYDQQNPYRFDRSAGLLFSNNQSINASGSPTFLDVRDCAFIGNRFTRDAASQNEDTVIAHHGFAMDFARRVSIVWNTFDVVNGPITNKQRNDGETILVEGGGPNRTENLGSVAAAGIDFISDPKSPFALRSFSNDRRPNLGVAIVSGSSVGQARRIVSYEGGTLKVDPPWDVIPEPGSHYSTFVWGLEKMLIIGNKLIDNPRGIWLYQTSARDIVIRNNEIRNGGGIYLRSYQNVASKIFTVQLNILIADNMIVNGTGDWMSHIILVGVIADDSAFGIGQLGIEVRRNKLIANQPNVTSRLEEYAGQEGYAAIVRAETPRPNLQARLIGPIFQQNRCVNCGQPFTVGSGVAGAVFSENTSEPITGQSMVTDPDGADGPFGGSVKTVIH
jgi:hypothetical protein